MLFGLAFLRLAMLVAAIAAAVSVTLAFLEHRRVGRMRVRRHSGIQISAPRRRPPARRDDTGAGSAETEPAGGAAPVGRLRRPR